MRFGSSKGWLENQTTERRLNTFYTFVQIDVFRINMGWKNRAGVKPILEI